MSDNETESSERIVNHQITNIFVMKPTQVRYDIEVELVKRKKKEKPQLVSQI